MIHATIPEIIKYLQETYSSITPQEQADREDSLKNCIFEHTRTVDLVFYKITQFKGLYELCSNKKSNMQIVQLGFIISNKTRGFMDTLCKWNKLESTNKTYPYMKEYMRRHYNQLKKVGALAINDLYIQSSKLHTRLKSSTKRNGGKQ